MRSASTIRSFSWILSLLLQLCSISASALNVTIIESQSYMSGHDMDIKWSTVLVSMGHTPVISPQTTLDSLDPLSDTDILIIASGIIDLPPERVSTIQQFLETGRPVYLQSEYLASYSPNIAFAQLVDDLGGTFDWTEEFSGYLNPMNALGTYATTNETVTPFFGYWYSVAGEGDCTIIPIITHDGADHGFHFVPPDPDHGTMITTTDQDWIRANASPALMKNIITHLIDPPTSNAFALDIGDDAFMCPGSSLVLDATVDNGSYVWQDGSTGPSFTVTEAGTYHVQVTMGICVAIDTIHVTTDLGSDPLGPDTTLCEGSDPLLLDATTENASYTWHDGSTGPTFTATDEGLYWVELDLNGCVFSDSIEIAFVPLPSVDLGVDTSLCDGESIMLDATTPDATFIWQNGSTDATFNVTNEGTFWVLVEVNGCAAADTIEIALVTTLPLDLGNDTTLCLGSEFILNAGQPGAAAYVWQDGSTDPTFTVTQAGSYHVQVTIGECSASDTIQVTTALVPDPLGPDTILCQSSGPLLLDATTANASYIWQDGSTGPTFSAGEEGLYWVDVDLNGCVHRDSIEIAFIPLPIVDLGGDAFLCEGETFLINASTPNATFVWQNGSTDATFNVTDEGTYWVQVEVNGCTAADTIEIALVSTPTVELGNDTTLCAGSELLMSASQPGASYVWQDGSSDPEFNAWESGSYWVEVSLGGCSASDTIVVTFIQMPGVDLGGHQEHCQDVPLMLDASMPGASYQWQDDSTDPVISVTLPGVYTVLILVGPCTMTASATISFVECEVELEMPNVFSPDGDGMNDRFLPILSKGIHQGELFIYNRWGQLISSTVLDTGWNGRHNGDPCPEGTYLWQVQYDNSVDGGTGTMVGSLTLLR